MSNTKCRWNVSSDPDNWQNCGEPVTVTRKGEGYCAHHDPVGRAQLRQAAKVASFIQRQVATGMGPKQALRKLDRSQFTCSSCKNYKCECRCGADESTGCTCDKISRLALDGRSTR